MHKKELETDIITDELNFPEGPIYLNDDSVLLVEIARGTLTKVFMNGKKEILCELGGGPNGAAIGPDGYCYICNNGGFEWEVSKDKKFMRPILQSKIISGTTLESAQLRIMANGC